MPASLTKPLLALTAGDLMSRPLIRIGPQMGVRDAARLLMQHRISGAPVVDTQGKCIGVFSTVDYLRQAHSQESKRKASLPLSCSYVERHTFRDGSERMLCSLSAGSCSIQVKQKGPDGEELIVCNQPHCVLSDSQVISLDKSTGQDVRSFMTADPVFVEPDTPIDRLAKMMIDADIHRVIVVENAEPVGIVSSTDLLAALAYARGWESSPEPCPTL